MDMMPNVQTFIGCDADYKDAEIAIFGAPFDSTTSYRPGTRFGCKAIRSESFGIETYSPYQDKDLTDISVFDCGDLELCFGSPEKALADIENLAAKILSDNKIPCMLGGEHLVTLGTVRAAAKKYPDMHIIHFDAHSDLRNDYLGEKLSHACVMHRCVDVVGSGRVHQFGIRSGDKEEFIFGKDNVYTNKFTLDGVEKLPETLGRTPVYITVDLDVLDPSEFPGTGTPEAGGVSFKQLLPALLSLSGLNIIGFDINELSPPYDPSGISTALACKLLRELLLAYYPYKNN